MARIAPLGPELLAEHSARLAGVEGMMGFVPNSMPTMARVPGLLEAFSELGRVVLTNPRIPRGLNQMVAQITSSAAGCRYCQAHTAHTAHNLGVPEEKLAELWNWAESDHFDAAERAALDLAFAAGSVPNATTQQHFDELAKHYDDEQITGFVATIAMFGYLNRWNDTMATDLEAKPIDFGLRVLAANGWEPGKHA